MRLIAVALAILLAAPAAQAVTLSTSAFANQRFSYDSDLASISGNSLALPFAERNARVALLGGVSRSRTAADVGTGAYSIAGAISRPGPLYTSSSIGRIDVTFRYRVDRDARVTFGGAYSGALTHDDDATSTEVFSLIQMGGSPPGEGGAEFLKRDRGSFSGELFYSRVVEAGRIYSFDLNMLSYARGNFANASHSLDYAFGIDTGGARMRIIPATAIPLPASAVLLAAALAALCLARLSARPAVPAPAPAPA